MGVRVVVLEIQDVGDVCATEAVDAVVGDDAIGDEVVSGLDAEVVYLARDDSSENGQLRGFRHHVKPSDFIRGAPRALTRYTRGGLCCRGAQGQDTGADQHHRHQLAVAARRLRPRPPIPPRHRRPQLVHHHVHPQAVVLELRYHRLVLLRRPVVLEHPTGSRTEDFSSTWN